MKKILGLVLALFTASLALAGCGGGNAVKNAEADNTLTVLNYGEYIDRTVISDFEQETGIKVLYEEATTPEEMYAKYKAGAINYDLICTSDYMVRRLMDEGELQKIDRAQLPNAQNIGEKYWKMAESFDAGNEYAVPYFWGTVGLLYDRTAVKGDIDSWEVLFNGDYAGKIIMQNSLRDAYMCALKYRGHSLNTTDRAELKEAQDILLAQKPDVEAYLVDEVREEMVAGNATIAVCYSGEAYLAHEYNENLAYAVPREGTNVWLDAWVVTKRCQNIANAEKFLDYLCRVDVASKNFEEIYYPTPNEALQATLPEAIKRNELIFPDEAALTQSEIYLPLDADTNELYSEMWKKLKAK